MLPVERCTFEIADGPLAGRSMHVIDEGPKDAPTVVLVHGNPTWSFLWRKVIAGLPEFRCIAPDLLGFGLSSRLRSAVDHTIGNHASTLVALVDALVPGPFIVVGQDWGGPLAVQLARALSDRVRGVVLGNTSVFVPERPRGTTFHTFSRLPVVSDFVFRGLGFPQNVMWSVQGNRRSIRGRVGKAYRWPLRRPSDRVGPLALARMVPNSPGHPSVASLREGQTWMSSFEGPTALVWGSKDPILGRALRRHERELPRAEVTVTEAGHFLQEEVPEAIVDAIKSTHARAQVRR
jgi:haloalkane dehalogenase